MPTTRAFVHASAWDTTANQHWIVHKVDGQPVVFIQEATGAELARLKASLAGFGGEFSEMHELPDAVARKVPKRMRGRPLTRSEAAGLLGQK